RKDMELCGAARAERGMATIYINPVGQGLGPLGRLRVNQTVGEPVTFAAGGRGIDQDGNGIIADSEGISTAPPRSIVFFLGRHPADGRGPDAARAGHRSRDGCGRRRAARPRPVAHLLLRTVVGRKLWHSVSS